MDDHPPQPGQVHIHVAQAGSHHQRRHLAVRDFLRAHPDQARGYERVKRAAAARHPGDRPGYWPPSRRSWTTSSAAAGTITLLALDGPDDPTGPVWIRLDRRAIQREQARSV